MSDLKSDFKYVETPPISREEALTIIESGVAVDICTAITRVAMHEDDWRWAQGLCLANSLHQDFYVRRCSLFGLEHIVRIHGKLDMMLVMPVLERLRSDPRLNEIIEDLLEMVLIHCEESGPQ